MRVLVASFVVLLIVAARPARAQEPPPPIPFLVIDLHGTVPRFPSDDQALADSRGMQLGELPGSGLGVQIGLHVYPLRWRAITFGLGGELTAGRSHQTPLEPAPGATALRPSDERFVSAAPQISFNFGTGHGWSYISERLKTVNYGGGARWFMKNHLAFSFDVRFYAINPGTPYLATGSPRTTLTIISAGVSVK
jgi:hypothetical protein